MRPKKNLIPYSIDVAVESESSDVVMELSHRRAKKGSKHP